MSLYSKDQFNVWFPALFCGLVIGLLAAACWDILRRRFWCCVSRFWPGVIGEVGLDNLSRVDVEERMRLMSEMLSAVHTAVTTPRVTPSLSMANAIDPNAAESSNSSMSSSNDYDLEGHEPVIHPLPASTGRPITFTATAYFADGTPTFVIRPVKRFFKRHGNGTVKWWKSSIVLQASLPIEACVVAQFEELARVSILEENRCTFQLGNWAILYYKAGKVCLHELKEGDVPVNVEARWQDEKTGIEMRGLYLNGAQVKVATEHTSTILRSVGPATKGQGDFDELNFNIEDLDVPREDAIIVAAKLIDGDGISLIVRSEATFIRPERAKSTVTEAFWSRLQWIFQPSKMMTKSFFKTEDRQPEIALTLPDFFLDQEQCEIIIEHWKGVLEIEILEKRKEVLHYLQELRESGESYARFSYLCFIRDRHSEGYWQRVLQELNELILQHVGCSQCGTHIRLRGGIRFLLGNYEDALHDLDCAHAVMQDDHWTRLYERALVKCMLARYSEALEDVCSVISINPNFSDIQELKTCIQHILDQRTPFRLVQDGASSLQSQPLHIEEIPDLLTGDERHSSDADCSRTVPNWWSSEGLATPTNSTDLAQPKDVAVAVGADAGPLNPSEPDGDLPQDYGHQCQGPFLLALHSFESSHEFRTKTLGFYYLKTAIRMLSDYIDDLRSSNMTIDDSVRSRIEEYEALLRELEEKRSREEPNSRTLLASGDRVRLIPMLLDYQAVLLSEALLDQSRSDDPPDLLDTNSLDTELRATKEDEESNGVPVYLSDTDFEEGGYMESLTAALDLCTNQVHEFKTLLSSVVIFKLLCKYLVESVAPVAEVSMERYRVTLAQLQKQELEISSTLRNSVSFCFESLVGLARHFQMVTELLKKCGSPDQWHVTAVELADVRPDKHKAKRDSEFSVAVRNCAWRMDLAELAFHALSKLVSEGTYTVKDASFKWSEHEGRMVLQIPGRLASSTIAPVQCDTSRLEDEDLNSLIEKLEKLVVSEKAKKRFYKRLSAQHEIADYLRKKLSGPTPVEGANFLPYSYTKMDPKSLNYEKFLDIRSSSMVATHIWNGVRVAVKSVRCPSRAKFEEEAAILGLVQHPNVVTLVGYGYIEDADHHGDTGLLVMELMDHDLRWIIEARLKVLPEGANPFVPMVAIDLMLQVAQAMVYLREHNVLHRGLKAKNILVNICKPLALEAADSDSANTSLIWHPVSAILPYTQEIYVAKLADFGLAKCRPQSSNLKSAKVGTPGYRAPEVYYASEGDSSYKWPADVYSFGMLCYEILTGKVPFADERSHGEVLHAKIMAGVRPPLENTVCPDALRGLIAQCWATRAEDRPSFDYIVRKLWECKVALVREEVVNDRRGVLEFVNDRRDVLNTISKVRTSMTKMGSVGSPRASGSNSTLQLSVQQCSKSQAQPRFDRESQEKALRG